jgi:anaerobic selenocysteine-containing dehydrogenase
VDKATYSITNAITSKITDSKPVPDLILNISKKLNLDLNISSYTNLLLNKAEILNADLKKLHEGYAWTDSTFDYQSTLQLWNPEVRKICYSKTITQAADFPLHFLPEQNLRFGTPQTGNTPLSLKTITNRELDNGILVISLNQETADKFNLIQNDLVILTSKSKSLKAKINIQETVMTDAVSVPLGFGHTNWDQFSRDKGENANALFSVVRHKYDCSWNSTKVKIEKI